MTVYSSANWTDLSLQRNSIQRAYEPVQIYFFTQLAKWIGAQSFFDVGANIGSFTIAIAQLPKIERVHSFEPMPTLYSELVENIRRNDGADKIRSHNVAASESTGSVDFAIIGNYSGANGIAATLIHDSPAVQGTMKVKTITLDEVNKASQSMPKGPCFIKIDVEGHELAVLKGACDLLQNACVLQVEMYGSRLECEEINFFLHEHGYRCFWKIGADNYFAKAELCPTDAQLLDVVSRAHSEMIRDFRLINLVHNDQHDIQNRPPIQRRLGPVQIRLFDPLARWLRKALGRG